MCIDSRSVLQCVAVCCSVFFCDAVCCSTLQCDAVTVHTLPRPKGSECVLIHAVFLASVQSYLVYCVTHTSFIHAVIYIHIATLNDLYVNECVEWIMAHTSPYINAFMYVHITRLNHVYGNGCILCIQCVFVNETKSWHTPCRKYMHLSTYTLLN